MKLLLQLANLYAVSLSLCRSNALCDRLSIFLVLQHYHILQLCLRLSIVIWLPWEGTLLWSMSSSRHKKANNDSTEKLREVETKCTKLQHIMQRWLFCGM